MNIFDFYDSNMTVRLNKRSSRLGNKDIVYNIYAYQSGIGALSYAIAAFDSEKNFAFRYVENYEDAAELFSIISDNDVDITSLGDVVDDYYYSKKIYNM